MKQFTRWPSELKLARCLWGTMPRATSNHLRQLLIRYGFSVAAGDLQLLNGTWYVTHKGLICLSARRRCSGISTDAVLHLSDPQANRWVFKATVYKTTRRHRFVGYGDANPSNVSSLVRGAEMRVAETRAVNRALRKAYGIGLCSVEELGSSAVGSRPTQPNEDLSIPANANGSRQHQTPTARPSLPSDPSTQPRSHAVKAYAADFCGRQTLKDASRELVESFISHLAEAAKEDRDGLVCKLNSYAQPAEAKP